MFRRPRSLVLFLLVALAGTFAIPDIADARSRQRRNYAEEWRQEELEDEEESQEPEVIERGKRDEDDEAEDQ